MVFKAPTARDALAEAKRRGRASQFRYRNSDGNPVHFEFVGVIDLLELGIECEKDEVWYDIVQRVRPMERKAKIIPPAKKLCALENEARRRGPSRSKGRPSGSRPKD